MKVTVDFSETEFPLIDAGLYDAVVTKVELTESMAGNAMMVFWMSVTGGEWDGYKLPPHRNMIGMKDRNYYLRETLRAMGHEPPPEKVDLETADYVGSKCRVQINHEEFEGKIVPRITGIFPIDDYIDVDEPAGDVPW